MQFELGFIDALDWKKTKVIGTIEAKNIKEAIEKISEKYPSEKRSSLKVFEVGHSSVLVFLPEGKHEDGKYQYSLCPLNEDASK